MEKNELPKLPGVYFFKDKNQTILYIGKAKNLYKRVQSYFSKQESDWKIAELIKEHDTISHIVTKNETEALLLEAQLIRDHKPKYNVLLKSGQPFLYLLFTQPQQAEALSTLTLVRNRKQKGFYFGPFLHKNQARSVYAYLTRTFKLFICNKKIANGCLDYHLGKCCGSCMPSFNSNEYIMRLELAKDVLKGHHKEFLARLSSAISQHSAQLEFEKAAHLKKYIDNFETIFETIKTKFTEDKYQKEVEEVTHQPVSSPDAQKALDELQVLLDLPFRPSTIDCFDISHFQSHYIVGSCIRFKDGVKDPKNFRHFKVRSLTQQNDYAALQEIVKRRYKNPEDLPDVICIDGGKGQRNAITSFIKNVPCISLAKREEQLFTDKHPEGIHLNLQTPLGRLLIALRDYAHHFAITFHRKQRSL